MTRVVWAGHGTIAGTTKFYGATAPLFLVPQTVCGYEVGHLCGRVLAHVGLLHMSTVVPMHGLDDQYGWCRQSEQRPDLLLDQYAALSLGATVWHRFGDGTEGSRVT